MMYLAALVVLFVVLAAVGWLTSPHYDSLYRYYPIILHLANGDMEIITYKVSSDTAESDVLASAAKYYCGEIRRYTKPVAERRDLLEVQTSMIVAVELWIEQGEGGVSE